MILKLHPFFIVLACLSTAVLCGCAAERAIRDAREEIRSGRFEDGVSRIDRAAVEYPSDPQVKSARLVLREESAARMFSQANSARVTGDGDAAEEVLRRLLRIDPGNERARNVLLDIDRERRIDAIIAEATRFIDENDLRKAQDLVSVGLKDSPHHVDLLRLRRDIALRMQRTAATSAPRLKETRPISLEFRDTDIRIVLEALSRSTGVNFVVDRDIRNDIKATIFLKQTRIEDALIVLATTSQLAYKVLDEQTVLLYANTPDKTKEYQDLLIRGFYLTNADAKQTAALLKSMLKLRDVFVDEKLNFLVIRDSPDAIQLAERLVAMHDLAEPEVMLEVELMEVKSSRLLDLGIQFPNSFSLTPLANGGGSSQMTLSDLKSVNSDRISVSTPNVLLNFKREVGDLNILANPRVRARNREKARILIGDRVPVITTTTSGNGFASESIQYVDVGIKLEVEPNVYFDDDVAIKMSLEVSSLGREIKTSTGALAYQIGTRSANTTLRLKDGETQILAGLISKEDRSDSTRVPGLGDLPIAGRLFSSQQDDSQRTEIILSITPRLIRQSRVPDAPTSEFWSGTESALRLTPMTFSSPTPGTPKASHEPATAITQMPSEIARSAKVQASTPSNIRQPTSVVAQDISKPAQNAATEAVSSPAAHAFISLEAPYAAKAGEIFEVIVKMRADGGVRSLPAQIVFDPARLQVAEMIEGPYFKAADGRSRMTHQVVGNEGRIVMSAQRLQADGVKGDGNVALIRFKALSVGTTTVSVRTAVALGVEGVDPETLIGPPLDVHIE